MRQEKKLTTSLLCPSSPLTCSPLLCFTARHVILAILSLVSLDRVSFHSQFSFIIFHLSLLPHKLPASPSRNTTFITPSLTTPFHLPSSSLYLYLTQPVPIFHSRTPLCRQYLCISTYCHFNLCLSLSPSISLCLNLSTL